MIRVCSFPDSNHYDMQRKSRRPLLRERSEIDKVNVKVMEYLAATLCICMQVHYAIAGSFLLVLMFFL